MSDGLNSRESVEALETFNAAARNDRESFEALETFAAAARSSRLSVEFLHDPDVPSLNARESFEALWQNPNISGLDSRLSIEILEGPVSNKQTWGFISIA